MDIWGILIWLLIGAVVGWIAGMIMKSKSSLLWNIVFGIVGSFVGGFIASQLNIGGGGLIVQGLIAVAGACLVIFVVKLIRGGK
ncbi:MAG: GlsB/YeaQ/YmgE family stress response membrane protein [Oscillospiraceae bacterium]|nr:GlsB/YeaQ/YmgE family stress response membrane protein [Oscillospiraceae bacterium]